MRLITAATALALLSTCSAQADDIPGARVPNHMTILPVPEPAPTHHDGPAMTILPVNSNKVAPRHEPVFDLPPSRTSVLPISALPIPTLSRRVAEDSMTILPVNDKPVSTAAAAGTDESEDEEATLARRLPQIGCTGWKLKFDDDYPVTCGSSGDTSGTFCRNGDHCVIGPWTDADTQAVEENPCSCRDGCTTNSKGVCE